MADPLYRQIAEDLRRKIESGVIEPGSQLPTEIELREQYENASRNTIRDVIRLLTTRGLVVTRPGRGTFVVEKRKPFMVPLTPSESMIGGDESLLFEEAVAAQGGAAHQADPRVESQKARAEIAEELGIELGMPVVCRHQERFIDGRPSSLQTSFYPMQFVDQGAVDLLQAVNIPQGVTHYLGEKLKIRQLGYRTRIRVRPPNAGELSFFKVPDDGSVLMMVIHRTAYGEGYSPIRYTVTVYAADRNEIVIDYRDVPPLREFVERL